MARRNIAESRILITGASSGIGLCIAEQAARRGARLALTARSADKLNDLAQNLSKDGGEAVAIPGDITRDEDRRRILDEASRRLGGLDVLINNAGVASFGHFADSTEAILRQIMEVNFFAPAELIRIAVPILVNGRQPAVVNIASMCGRRGLPAWPEYSASKFALCGMTEAFRGELARYDIDILLIVPGLTKSELPQHLLRNEGRMKIEFDKGMAPDEVATGVLNALEKNRLETVLGREARLILKLNRFFPSFVDRKIKQRVLKLYEQPV
jgi:short-subunit dehydrogenase